METPGLDIYRAPTWIHLFSSFWVPHPVQITSLSPPPFNLPQVTMEQTCHPTTTTLSHSNCGQSFSVGQTASPVSQLAIRSVSKNGNCLSGISDGKCMLPEIYNVDFESSAEECSCGGFLPHRPDPMEWDIWCWMEGPWLNSVLDWGLGGPKGWGQGTFLLGKSWKWATLAQWEELWEWIMRKSRMEISCFSWGIFMAIYILLKDIALFSWKWPSMWSLEDLISDTMLLLNKFIKY